MLIELLKHLLMLIGNCEVYFDSFKDYINSIEWTLPEYGDEIDPDGELYDSEVLSRQLI